MASNAFRSLPPAGTRLLECRRRRLSSASGNWAKRVLEVVMRDIPARRDSWPLVRFRPGGTREANQDRKRLLDRLRRRPAPVIPLATLAILISNFALEVAWFANG
jgi:hypothetical protein